MTTMVAVRPRAYARRVTSRPKPTPEQWRAARAAVAAHDRAKDKAQQAQDAMYAAIRVLKTAGATKPEIAEGLDVGEDHVKWIVEDKATKRRARRQAEADTGE